MMLEDKLDDEMRELVKSEIDELSSAQKGIGGKDSDSSFAQTPMMIKT